jgi:hypothetical protein
MTPKGYLTGDAMNFWVEKVLFPSVHEKRVRLENDITTVHTPLIWTSPSICVSLGS